MCCLHICNDLYVVFSTSSVVVSPTYESLFLIDMERCLSPVFSLFMLVLLLAALVLVKDPSGLLRTVVSDSVASPKYALLPAKANSVPIP